MRGVALSIAVLDAKILAKGPALAFETFFGRMQAAVQNCSHPSEIKDYPDMEQRWLNLETSMLRKVADPIADLRRTVAAFRPGATCNQPGS